MSDWLYRCSTLVMIIIFVAGPRLVRAQDHHQPVSSSATGLTLPLAVEIALRRNPMIRATSAGQEIAAARLGEAKAGRLPLLQFNETFTHSNNPVFAFGTLLEQGRFGPQNLAIDALNNPGSLSDFRTSISISLPLFDQLRTSSNIARARMGKQKADAQLVLVQQQIRYKVIEAYYGVLVAEAEKRVADEALRLAQSDAKRIGDLFETGLVVASDLLATQVQVAEFRQQQIQADGNVITAYARLNTILGLPTSVPQKIEGQLLERRFDVPPQDRVIQLALAHRMDLHQFDLEVQSRQQGIRQAIGQYLPRLDFFASFGNSGQGLASGSTDFTVGAGLTFNILDWGRKARIRQARGARQVADAEKQGKVDQIRLDVIGAYQHYISARERVRVAGRAVDQASETLRIVQDRYQVGLTTITEVLRAETTSVQAHLNLLSARYDYTVGYARTLLLSGQLADVSDFIL